MTTTSYWQAVSEYPNRQFVTGEKQKPGSFVPDDVYSQALDALVVCCADAAVMCEGKWLIAKRAWEPQPDWWVIGGRMRKGERIEQALRRNLRRELKLDIPEERLLGVIGYYNLIWDKRAQKPAENGCHMFSITSIAELTPAEKEQLILNEEYVDFRWVDPVEVIANANDYHSCLVQMAKDIQVYFEQKRS